MNLLVVSNLYPPQELGGYGRSIADFVWGLQERGHSIQVLSSDAPHLGASSDLGPSGEAVDRQLQLKGSYEGGVRHLQDPQAGPHSGRPRTDVPKFHLQISLTLQTRSLPGWYPNDR